MDDTTSTPAGRRRAPASAPPTPHLSAVRQAALFTFRQPTFTARCRAELGPTFGLRLPGAPPVVLTSDHDAVKAILSGPPLATRHGNDNLRPLVGDGSLMVLEPKEHLARRKLLMPAFHGERIQGYASLMAALVDDGLRSWRVGDVVTVHPFAQRLTLEVIVQAVLGIGDPAVGDRFMAIFRPLFTPAMSVGLFVPGFLEQRANPLARRWRRLRSSLDAFLLDQIAAARRDPGLAERPDVLAMLIQATDDAGDGLDDVTVRDELVALLAAGHETTATAIAWALDLLVHDPAELAAATHAARTGDQVHLEALAKEVLRLRPPVPLGGTRLLREPTEVGPYLLEVGTLVCVDAMGLHHDPERFPDPMRLRAGRFLGQSPEPYTWVPFGGGAHRCIGAAMALLEIEVALAGILGRFDVAATRPPERYSRRAVTLCPKGGTTVRLLAGT
jgi:cytochrome P450